ncbi:MAG: hypothetical protein N2445_02090 [Acidobacteria bacterium]|nr:hypothetical protein [Acidobacteriota bacterium]
MKKEYFFLFSILVLISSIFALMAATRCFDQLVVDLQACSVFPSDSREREVCIEGAWKTFEDCLGRRTTDKLDVLYKAKLPSIILARANGKPFKGVTSFNIDEPGYYFVNIYNGKEQDISSKVSSAKISISPYDDIFTPSDFNKQVSFLVKKVYLEKGYHSFSGIVKGQPESFLTVVVSDRDLTDIPL